MVFIYSNYVIQSCLMCMKLCNHIFYSPVMGFKIEFLLSACNIKCASDYREILMIFIELENVKCATIRLQLLSISPPLTSVGYTEKNRFS